MIFKDPHNLKSLWNFGFSLSLFTFWSAISWHTYYNLFLDQEYLFLILSCLLGITTIILFIRYALYKRYDFELIHSYLNFHYVLPNYKYKVYIPAIILVISLGVLIGTTDNLVLYSITFIIFTIADLIGESQIIKIISQYKNNNKSAININSFSDVLCNYYLKIPIKYKIALTTWFGFAVFTLAYYSNEMSSSLLLNFAYIIQILLLIISEIFISLWRNKRATLLSTATQN